MDLGCYSNLCVRIADYKNFNLLFVLKAKFNLFIKTVSSKHIVNK